MPMSTYSAALSVPRRGPSAAPVAMTVNVERAMGTGVKGSGTITNADAVMRAVPPSTSAMSATRLASRAVAGSAVARSPVWT